MNRIHTRQLIILLFSLIMNSWFGCAAENTPFIYNTEIANTNLFNNFSEFEVTESSIRELQAAMAKGVITAERLVELYLERIDAYENQGPEINAIIQINPDALSQARELDQERKEKGPRGPLHGIPILVKDAFNIKGFPTTLGTSTLLHAYPTENAFQIDRLLDAGVIILAKTNLSELATGTGVSGWSTLGGQTRNPYDLERGPGDSSGGSAAGIAANFAVVSMGSDAGGSIRNPASFNNLFGIRPTLGLSSRIGTMGGYISTVDTSGPIAKTMEDIALVLDATVGYDPDDWTTHASIGKIPETYTEFLDPDALNGARLGIIQSIMQGPQLDPDVARVIWDAVKRMEDLGATVIPIEFPIPRSQVDSLLGDSNYTDSRPSFDAFLATIPHAPTYFEILWSGKLPPIIQIKYFNMSFWPSQLNYIAYIKNIQERRRAQTIIVDFMDRLAIDAMVYPSSITKPIKLPTTDPLNQGPELQENSAGLFEESSITRGAKLAPLAGLPAMTIPAGFTPNKLPVGIELMGRPWAEPTLIKLGYAYEQATLPRRLPPTTPAL